MGVLTIEEWNDLIDRINDLGAHLPPGCQTDSSTPPDTVTAPHQWSVSDITEAQNRLKDICPNAEFTTVSPGDKWRQAYIDELNDVLDNASAEWCGCEEACCVPQGSGTVQINPGGYYVTIPFSQIVEQYLYGYVSYEGQGYAIRGGNHLGGTHIMGTSPASSVVDATLRSWDHQNLYLASGGAMPTIGTANVTLTIAALCFKSAGHMIEQLRAEQAPAVLSGS